MIRTTLLILLGFLPFFAFTQIGPDEETGNKYYELFDYTTAIKNYKKTTKLTIDGKRKLALSYKRISEFVNSEQVSKEIVSLPDHNSNDVFNYVSILRMNKKYDDSEEWMKKYEQMVGMDNRIIANRITQSRINDLLVSQGNMNVVNLGFNSNLQEFAPMFFGGSLVYTAPGLTSQPEHLVNNVTKQNFLRLYVLDTADLSSMRRTYFNEQVMGKMNEGVACFSADKNLMVFSGNDVLEVEKNQKIRVQLFFVVRDSLGKWGNPKPFAYNDSRYSFGHPALTADGKTLYFSSNREGSLGGSDLWKCELKNDNTWSEPINLGPRINTESNEFYPFFVEKTNNLFFASDGRGGLGGLDVFVIELKDNVFDYAQNLGAPINSSYDDFSFIANDDCSLGYFASNRDGGKGDDDIYQFAITHDWVPLAIRTLNGHVTDQNGTPLENTVLQLKNERDSIIGKAFCDQNGNYTVSYEHANEKTVFAKSVYGDLTKPIIYGSDSITATVDFVFQIPKKLKALNDISRKGNSVYFHTAKWDLTTNGKQVLDYYVKCMLEDSTLKVEISSFADQRASNERNVELSKMRMESTINYLVSKGVSLARIKGAYFGETTEGVDYNDSKCECTEQKLELCRRADLKFIR